MLLPIKRLNKNSRIPQYSSKEAAGLDLFATERVTIPAHSRVAIKTGIAIELPVGYVGEVTGRSGLAFRNGLFCHIGTIDSDYRGEITVLIYNTTDSDYLCLIGDRIAQLIVRKFEQVELMWKEELNTTERGTSGLGSTGY